MSSLTPSNRSLLRTALTALADAWGAGRVWLLCTLVLHVLLALVPALQVVLVARVLTKLQHAVEVWPTMLALAALVGASFQLGQCANAASQRLALRMRFTYQVLALEFVAASGPSALARPDTVEAAQTAHESATAVDTVAGDTVRLSGSVMTAAALCFAVGAINPLAGLLVAASLVPTVWAFTRIARAEEEGWPKFGAAAR